MRLLVLVDFCDGPSDKGMCLEVLGACAGKPLALGAASQGCSVF